MQYINARLTERKLCPNPLDVYKNAAGVQGFFYDMQLCKHWGQQTYYPYTWVNNTFRPFVRPYVMATSQWQRWNLFSPNPLRKVIRFVFDVQEGDTWRTFKVIDGSSEPLYKRAYTLKTIRRLEEEQRYEPLRERLLQTMCKREHIQPGRNVRLRVRSYVIPMEATLSLPVFWKKFEPQWNEYQDVSTLCSYQA